MAEFASVVDAVNGAKKIQEDIKKSNTALFFGDSFRIFSDGLSVVGSFLVMPVGKGFEVPP